MLANIVLGIFDSMSLAKVLFYYLIGINVFSFMLFSIDLARHTKTGETIKPVWLFMFVTVFGGALGVNIYFLLFFPTLKRNGANYYEYHDAKDHYSFWRILAFVMLLLDVFLVVMARDKGLLDFTFISVPKFSNLHIWQKILSLKARHLLLPVWLVVVNVITFIIFGIDKKKALNDEYRIPEIRLYILALIGGSIGGMLAMKAFNHKVNKRSFSSGMPLFLLANIITVIYLIHRGLV